MDLVSKFANITKQKTVISDILVSKFISYQKDYDEVLNENKKMIDYLSKFDTNVSTNNKYRYNKLDVKETIEKCIKNIITTNDDFINNIYDDFNQIYYTKLKPKFVYNGFDYLNQRMPQYGIDIKNYLAKNKFDLINYNDVSDVILSMVDVNDLESLIIDNCKQIISKPYNEYQKCSLTNNIITFENFIYVNGIGNYCLSDDSNKRLDSLNVLINNFAKNEGCSITEKYDSSYIMSMETRYSKMLINNKDCPVESLQYFKNKSLKIKFNNKQNASKFLKFVGIINK